MLDWLLTNLDEVLGLVLGLTTAGAFWYAYRGRPVVAAVIGLSGNAGWWVFAVTVQAWMLLTAVAIMTFIHLFNLRRGLRARRPHGRATVPVHLGVRPSDPAAVVDVVADALRVSRSGPPCPVCHHPRGSHEPHGCGVILDSGAPCACHFTPEETQ